VRLCLIFRCLVCVSLSLLSLSLLLSVSLSLSRSLTMCDFSGAWRMGTRATCLNLPQVTLQKELQVRRPGESEDFAVTQRAPQNFIP
jgi:hypothetical protein